MHFRVYFHLLEIMLGILFERSYEDDIQLEVQVPLPWDKVIE